MTSCLLSCEPNPSEKGSALKRKEFDPTGSKFFPLRIDPFTEGSQNKFERVATPESVSVCLNSFPASGDFDHLLITFANSLDPDQARQNVGPDLDPNCLTLMVFRKEFFEEVNFRKKSIDDKKASKITLHAKS